jgi:hypothetical protein
MSAEGHLRAGDDVRGAGQVTWYAPEARGSRYDQRPCSVLLGGEITGGAEAFEHGARLGVGDEDGGGDLTQVQRCVLP